MMKRLLRVLLAGLLIGIAAVGSLFVVRDIRIALGWAIVDLYDAGAETPIKGPIRRLRQDTMANGPSLAKPAGC